MDKPQLVSVVVSGRMAKRREEEATLMKEWSSRVSRFLESDGQEITQSAAGLKQALDDIVVRHTTGRGEQYTTIYGSIGRSPASRTLWRAWACGHAATGALLKSWSSGWQGIHSSTSDVGVETPCQKISRHKEIGKQGIIRLHCDLAAPEARTLRLHFVGEVVFTSHGTPPPGKLFAKAGKLDMEVHGAETSFDIYIVPHRFLSDSCSSLCAPAWCLRPCIESDATACLNTVMETKAFEVSLTDEESKPIHFSIDVPYLRVKTDACHEQKDGPDFRELYRQELQCEADRRDEFLQRKLSLREKKAEGQACGRSQ